MCTFVYSKKTLTKKLNIMKRTNVFLVVLFAASLILSSCGKYDEGPSISLRSKTSRLTGIWKVTKAVYNGTEQTLSDDDKATTTEFTKDGKITTTSPQWGSFNGTWEFNSDKTKIVTKYTFGGQTSTSEVTILRLTNKELFVEHVDGSDVERTEYEKQ